VRPWTVLERVETAEGSLELRSRADDDFLITIGGRVLMTSAAHASEDTLARLACESLTDRKRPRVLLGGLGMAFSLRAALDRLPRDAAITVVELNARVVAWCKGPLAPLTKNALADRRVKVHVGDVAASIGRARPGTLDAIVIDLYEGPHEAMRQRSRGPDPLYGIEAIERTALALALGGVFAVWSEERDTPFERRLETSGFRVAHERSGRGRSHVVYLATRLEPKVVRAPRKR